MTTWVLTCQLVGITTIQLETDLVHFLVVLVALHAPTHTLPDSFLRAQLGRIGRQPHHTDPVCVLLQQSLDHLGRMGSVIVHRQCHLALWVRGQLVGARDSDQQTAEAHIVAPRMDHVQNLSESERTAFEKALTIYYSEGCGIVDAFGQVEPGLIDRYYRRRKKYPAEIQAIDTQARAAVQREIASQQFAFQMCQSLTSMEIQRDAAQSVVKAMPTLRRIALGQPLQIRDANTGELKTTMVYPRDQLQAIRVLLDLAREGLVGRRIAFQPCTDVESHQGSFSHGFGALAEFSMITATAPDGTRFTATRESGDVVDYLPEEDDRSNGQEARHHCEV